jgi:hypothetical protein
MLFTNRQTLTHEPASKATAARALLALVPSSLRKANEQMAAAAATLTYRSATAADPATDIGTARTDWADFVSTASGAAARVTSCWLGAGVREVQGTNDVEIPWASLLGWMYHAVGRDRALDATRIEAVFPKLTSLARAMDTLVTLGLDTTKRLDYEAWETEVIALRARATPAQLTDLSLSAADWWDAEPPSTAGGWATAGGSDLHKLAAAVTFGGDCGVLDEEEETLGSLSRVVLATGGLNARVNTRTDASAWGQGWAQLIAAFGGTATNNAAGRETLAYNVVTGCRTRTWPKGCGEWHPSAIVRRVDTARRAQYAAKPSDEIFAFKWHAGCFKKRCPHLAKGLGDDITALEAIALVREVAAALETNSSTAPHRLFESTERAVADVHAADVVALQGKAVEWADAIKLARRTLKREREDAAQGRESSTRARGEEGHSSAPSGFARAYIEDKISVVNGAQFKAVESMLINYHAKMGAVKGYDLPGLLEATLTSKLPVEVRPTGPAELLALDTAEADRKPIVLLHMFASGKVDAGQTVPSLQFLHRVVPIEVWGDLAGRIAVRCNWPAGLQVPTPLQVLRLEKIVKAFRGKNWGKDLDFVNDVDAELLHAYHVRPHCNPEK